MKIEEQVKPENSAQNLLIARLQEEVNHPADIDAATERLGISPFLINPYLATPLDMSFIGLGRGVNLPIQITTRQGGRRSLYFLHPGEKVLASIVATSRGLVLRYVSRDTGRSIPAQAGDQYSEEFRDIEGNVLSRSEGKLEILNAAKGEGRLVFPEGSPAGKWRWRLWSCFADGDSLASAK